MQFSFSILSQYLSRLSPLIPTTSCKFLQVIVTNLVPGHRGFENILISLLSFQLFVFFTPTMVALSFSSSSRHCGQCH